MTTFAKCVVSAALAVLLSTLAPRGADAAGILIVFDNVGPAGGTISYDGAGGAAIGSGIGFDVVNFSNGVDPLVSLTCVSCLLDFTTGGNLVELDGLWVWAAGGSFVVQGTVLYPDNTVLTSGVLLEGFFDGPLAANATLSAGNLLKFGGGGFDTKNEALLQYFGVSTADFIYATTAISMPGCVPQTTLAFSCAVSEADITNVTDENTILVPEPGVMTMLGIGLLGVCWKARRTKLQRPAQRVV